MRGMRSSPRRGNSYSVCLSDGLGFREPLITSFVMAAVSPQDGGSLATVEKESRQQACKAALLSGAGGQDPAAQTGICSSGSAAEAAIKPVDLQGGGSFLQQQTETRRTKCSQFLGQ